MPKYNKAAHDKKLWKEEDSIYSLREDLENSFFPNGQLVDNQAQKLLQLIHIHGDETALAQLDEYLLQYQIHGTPILTIAKQLDVSTSMARKLMGDFNQRQSVLMDKLNIFSLMADSTQAMKYCRDKMMRVVSDPNHGVRDKMAAVDKITRIESTKYNILQSIGFFDRKRYSPESPDEFEPNQSALDVQHIIGGILAESKKDPKKDPKE